jgi:hypothetical protein
MQISMGEKGAKGGKRAGKGSMKEVDVAQSPVPALEAEC